jgi:nucleoside-diphosphate-sugar epimerase
MADQRGGPRLSGRVLVTGIGGFIAGHLAARLFDDGCEIVGLDRPGAPEGRAHRLAREGRGKLVPVSADIERGDAVRACLAGERLDYAVHLAAKVGDWGDPAEFDRINVDGTAHVLEAALEAGAKAVVHVSSIAAMGFDPGLGAGPEVPPQITCEDAYSRTKALGEVVARRHQATGAPVIVIRPGDVYGPGCEPWVNRPLRMMRSHQMLLVDGGRGHFAHVWVEHLVDAFVRALATEEARGRVYVVTDREQSTTMGSYFTALARACGAPAPRISLPRAAALPLAAGLEHVASLAGFVPPFTRSAVKFVTKHGSYSIDAAERDLGYAPWMSLDDGIARIASEGA